MRFHTKKRRTPTINIVSLIDILCLLLIFFIVTTTFKKEEAQVKIDLPESSTAKKSTDEVLPTILSVKEEDQIFLDDKQVPLDQLTTILKERLALKPDWKVALRADKKMSWGTMVKIMDATKNAGIRQLPTYTEEAKPTP